MYSNMSNILLPAEIEVVQRLDHRYANVDNKKESENKYMYEVVKIRNCRNFYIGELFAKEQLEGFMEMGINVTIVG
jgi:hypothetical protein